MGLVSLNEQFGVVDKLILTYDEEKTIELANGTVKILPVWKWLLGFED